MIRLLMIFGGKSIEHEASLISAASVINAIDKEKYEIKMIGITRDGRWLLYDGTPDMIPTGEWQNYAELKLLAEPEKYNLQVISSNKTLADIADVAFPMLHGPKGEDGTIQGVLEVAEIPYVGCSLIGSGLAMDKDFTKNMLRQAGLPVCPWMTANKEEIEDGVKTVITNIEEQLPYPMFVKPASLGGSVGVAKVYKKEELRVALLAAAKIDRKIIIEKGINCREIEVGIIGNFVPQASAAGEVICKRDFFDSIAKAEKETYTSRIIPAELPTEMKTTCKELAINAYKTLGLRGFARVDLFIQKHTNSIYINEINTIPAFADNSMFPALWECVGLSYMELIDRLIGYALEK